MNEPIDVRSADLEALQKCLENLQIQLAGDGDNFTVFSTSEPLFCFTRPTVEELGALVIETLRSYLESFYQVSDVQLRAITEPIEEPEIPQQRLKPISLLRPVFGAPHQEGHGYAFT